MKPCIHDVVTLFHLGAVNSFEVIPCMHGSGQNKVTVLHVCQRFTMYVLSNSYSPVAWDL